MKRKILGVVMAIMLGVTAVTMPVNAAGACQEPGFLGLKPWYAGLTKEVDGKCVVKSPDGDDEGLAKFVWTIILNILADLFMVLGFLAIGYLMYGGFKYIMSQGEPGKMAMAKAIIARAVVGAAIALLAGVITNTIISILNGAMS